MNQYLTKYQLLQNCQFGFRPNRSTIDALITLIEKVRQDWDSNTTNTSDLIGKHQEALDKTASWLEKKQADLK